MTAVVVIANPLAGKGGAVAAGAQAAHALAQAGISVRLATPGDPAGEQREAAQAVAAGARAVLACGGDGTVHWAMQALAGTGVPFGIIPAGTGNDIAAAIGHAGPAPSVLGAEFAAGLKQDARRLVDLGRVESAEGVRHFAGVLSSGFDSTVNEAANAMRWPRGSARYVVAMLAELRRLAPVPYRIRVDGQPHEGSGILVSVGNGTSFGGGMRVCPEAVMDDGLLDLLWLTDIGRAAFLRVFPRVYRGTHVTHPAVRSMRGTRIELDAPGQVAYADGERIGPLPVAISVVAGGLCVLERRPSS